VRLTWSLATHDVTGDGAAVAMNVLGWDPNRPLAASAGPLDMASGTTPWTTGAAVLDVPPEAEVIFLGLAVARTGEARVRTLRFEVVDDTVPATDLRASHLMAPRNLDFAEARPLPPSP
jgi:hypothetical protein